MFEQEKAAGDFYAEIKGRFDLLIAWGAETKAPPTKPDIDAWREFSAEWEDTWFKRDLVLGLRAHAVGLNRAEEHAALKGYVIPGRKVEDRDPDAISRAAEAHTTVQEGIDAAKDVASDVGGDIKKGAETAGGGLAELWGKLPRTAKVAGGVVLGAYLVKQLATVAGEARGALRDAREARERRRGR